MAMAVPTGGALANPPVPLRVNAIDLIAALGEGDVTPPLRGRPPLDCVRGQVHPPFPSFYSTLSQRLRPFHQRVTVGGGGPGRVELRDALLFPAPRAFSYVFVPPEAPRLEFSYYLFACRGGTRTGVTLRVTIEDADGELRFRIPLPPPPPRAVGPRWQDVSVDLPLDAGRPARLEVAFETERTGTVVGWAQPTITGYRADPPGDDVNVLLIVVDALRADVLGSARRPTLPSITPNLDQLFTRGASFTQAYSVANQTRPSTLGLLVSQAPSIGGFHSRSWTLSDRRKAAFYDSDPPLLTRVLAQAGWAVAHIGHNHFLWEGQAIGFDHGFDRAADFRAVPEDTVEITAEAVRFISRNADRRWFVLLNYTAPHTPYDPPEPWKSELIERLGDKPRDGIPRGYLGEVAYVDDTVARVFDALETLDLRERTLVILTADHAETMHSTHACLSPKLEMPCEYNHGVTQYAEEMHVPLVFDLPGRTVPGRAVATPVSHIDLAPTVLDLLGLPAERRHTGRSLAPALAGGVVPPTAVYSEGRYAAAVRVGDLRLIVHSREDDIRPRARVGRGGGPLPLYELFDLAVDPNETRNLALEDDDRLEPMLAELDEVRAHFARLATTDAVHRPATPEAETIDLGPAAGNVLRLEAGDSPHRLVARIGVAAGETVTCGATQGVTACSADAANEVLATFSARPGDAAELHFTTTPWAAAVHLDLTLDGEPLPVDRLRLGPYGVRLLSEGESLDQPAHLRLAAGIRPPQTVGDELAVYFWRDPPSARGAIRVAAPWADGGGGDPDANMSEDVRSVLRSLGYTK